MARETALKDAILKAIRDAGGYAVKIHVDAMQEIGTPDILVCLDGRFLAIETKQLGETATPTQEHKLQKIRDARGYGAVVDDLVTVIRALSYWPHVCHVCLKPVRNDFCRPRAEYSCTDQDHVLPLKS